MISQESTVAFGADHTSGPLQRFLEYLFDRSFTQPEWWRLHIIIRKCGHFTGYGLLSAAGFRAVWMTFRLSTSPLRRQFVCHGLAMLGTLMVASSDELHQHYLPNRSGSIVDVSIDCAGALIVQLVIWLWLRDR